MRALAALLLTFGLALAPPPAAAQISVLGLKNSLVQFALDKLSTPDQFEITAASVDEPEDGVTELVDVRIRDAAGVWFEAEGIALSWSPSRILLGELRIDSLVARGVRVLRPPQAAPTVEEEPAAGTQESGFSWPRAPIGVVVREMRLDGVFLAPGVLGPDALRFDAQGSARDVGAEQSVSLNVTRTDDVEGVIDLQYLRDFDAGTLRVALDAREAAGGLVAALAGLPSDSASRASVTAEGPLSDWAVTFEVEAEDVLTAQGSGDIDLGPPFALAAEATVTPGPALSEQARAALAPEATLTVRAREGPDGLIDVETATIRAPALDVTADGTYARDSGELQAEVTLEARAALSALVPGVDFERVAFDGTASGALSDLTAEGALALDGVETAPADIGTGRFDTRLRYAPPLIGFALDGRADGLRLDRLQPETVGAATLTAEGQLDRDALRLDALALNSPLMTVDASGALGGDGTGGIDYTVRAPELAPLAAAYNVEAGGALAVQGRAEGDLAAPRIAGEAALDGLSYQGTDWGRIALSHDVTLGAAISGDLALTAEGTPYGPADVATAFRFEDQRLSLSGLSAEALGLAISGDVAYALDDNLAEGALDLRTADLAALGEQAGQSITGEASGRVVLEAEDGTQGARIDLSGAGLEGFGAAVERVAVNAALTDLYGAPRGEGTVSLEGVSAEEYGVSIASLAFDGSATREAERAEAEGVLTAEAVEAMGAALGALRAEGRVTDLTGAPDGTVTLEATDIAYAPAEARVASLRFEGDFEDVTAQGRAEGRLTIENAAAAGATVARIAFDGSATDLTGSPAATGTLTADAIAYPAFDARVARVRLEAQGESLIEAPRVTGVLTAEDLAGAGATAARLTLDGRGRDLASSPSAEGVLTVEDVAYPDAEASVARITLDAHGEDLLGAVSATGELTVAEAAGAGAAVDRLTASFDAQGLTTPTPAGDLTARLEAIDAPGAAADWAELTASLAAGGENGALTAALRTAPVRLDAGRVASATADLSATGVYGDDPAVSGAVAVSDAAFGTARLQRARVAAEGPLSALALTVSAAGAVGAGEDALPFGLDGRATVNAAEAAAGTVSADIGALTARYGEAQARLRQPARAFSEAGVSGVEGLDLELPGAALTGDAALHPDGLVADMRVALVDFGPLAELANLPLHQGRADLDLSLDTRPGSATGRLALDANGIRLDVRDVEFQDVETAAFDLDAAGRWDGSRAALDATLTGPFRQPMSLDASIPLRAGQGLLPAPPPGAPIDGRLQWRGRLGDLWALVPAPDHILSGEAFVDLTFGGTLDDPRFGGDVSLRDGRYENLMLGTILTDLTAATEIAPDGALRLNVRAEDGVGNPVTAEVALDGNRLDAELRSDAAVLVRRDDARAAVSLAVDASGDLTEALDVTGTVRIERAEIRLVNATPPSVASLGEIRWKGEPEPEEETGGAGAAIRLDLDILAEDEVFVRGRGLDSEWRIDLDVQGTAADPRITGAIERIRGVLNFIGFQFDLEQGEIRFRGESPIDPSLNIALTRENEGVTGGIFVEGTASDPEVAFRSRPSLPESEVLPRVLFGKSEQSLTGAEAAQLAVGLAVLLDGGGDFGIGAIRSAVGLDVLRLETEGEDTSVEVGSNLADNVYVGAKQPLRGGGATFEVEIEVFDNVTVDSEIDAEGGTSFGLNWKKDF